MRAFRSRIGGAISGKFRCVAAEWRLCEFSKHLGQISELKVQLDEQRETETDAESHSDRNKETAHHRKPTNTTASLSVLYKNGILIVMIARFQFGIHSTFDVDDDGFSIVSAAMDILIAFSGATRISQYCQCWTRSCCINRF